MALSSQDRDGIYRGVARLTGSRVYKPFFGKPILMGGVGVVYDCVGSAASIEDGLRLARARGRVVVIGVEKPKRFEWSPLWFKEISLVGSLSVGLEDDHGQRRHTYQIALDLILEKKVNLKALLTHTFQLPHYREAIRTCTNKGRSKAIKVAFSFQCP